jgi:hypothetical protein
MEAVDSSGGGVDNAGRKRERAPAPKYQGSHEQTVSTRSTCADIPLVGDAPRLWTTDDAASELPGLEVAGDSSAGEGSGDSLMHGNS